MNKIRGFFENRIIAKIIFPQKKIIPNKKKELTNYMNGYNNKILSPPIIKSIYPQIYMKDLPKIFGNAEQKYYVLFNEFEMVSEYKNNALLMPKIIEIYDSHDIMWFKCDLISSGIDINFINNVFEQKILYKNDRYICASHVIPYKK